MGIAFVISGLRRKPAHLAGQIEAEETRQAERREGLTTLDAVIRLFEPQSNPELIAPVRPCTTVRNLFFRRGEQMRLCIQALREAAKPIPCRQVVDFCVAAKGPHDLDSIRCHEKFPKTKTRSNSEVATKPAGKRCCEKDSAWSACSNPFN
jgi:hypothetical protein